MVGALKRSEEETREEEEDEDEVEGAVGVG